MSEIKLVPSPDVFSIEYKDNVEPCDVPIHYHNDYQIIFVCDGKAEFKIGNKTYYPEKNTLIFISNVEPHESTVIAYPYRRHVIMFKSDFLNTAVSDPLFTSIFKFRPSDYNHILTLDQKSSVKILKIFQQLHEEFQNKELFWENCIRMYLGILLVTLYRISESHFPLSRVDNTSNKKLITDIQKYIEENFMENISLKDVAALFHTDMYYLCHLFKDITGFTFKNYLTLRRISFAKDLLAYTDKSVIQVGLESGFNSVNSFIRTFKKNVGITPYQYKKLRMKQSGR